MKKNRTLKKKTNKFLDEIKSIIYWNKIDKLFQKNNKNNIYTFKLSFKHNSNIFSNFQPDDETKINAYANFYGYKIIDEYIGTQKSTYLFERIKEKK